MNPREGVTDLKKKYEKFPSGGKLGAFTVQNGKDRPGNQVTYT